MKIFKLLLFFFAVCITGCSPRYYAPDTHNIPLISRKGETNLAVSGSSDRVEFQASHGLTSAIALKANGGFYFPSNEYFEAENGGSGKFIEFGAGYFKKLNENWIFETYGIFGMGSLENNFVRQSFDTDALGKLSAKIRRYGIQPNIGYKNEDFIFGASTRFLHLSLDEIEGDLVSSQINQQTYLRENNSHFLIEPAIIFGIAFNKFSVKANLGLSLNLTDFDFEQYNSYISFTTSFNF